MRIAIIGRSEILYNTALHLVDKGFTISCILTSKEAPEYYKNAIDYEELAKKLNVPFRKSSKINENISFLKKSNSDISVSVNYTGIISEQIINLFPLGILNAHGGDLPKYRGNACQAWAIINGEERIGLCIHKMIGGELDSGDIISRDYLNINIDTKVGDVWDWMRQRTPYLFTEALENLSNDHNFVLEKQSKDIKNALRCYPRRPEDGKINWEKTSLEIIRLIKASGWPYGGAFCEFEGQKLTISDASYIKCDENFLSVPGQVIGIGDSYVDIGCGEGKIRIQEIKYNGQKLNPSKVITSFRQRLI